MCLNLFSEVEGSFLIMAVREIITVPHPTLKKNSRKVTDFGPSLQTLIDDMVETMRLAPGVGLAAPQVNVLQRVIAVEFGDEEDETVEPRLFTVVNPEIVRPSSETVIGTEGCLSIPCWLVMLSVVNPSPLKDLAAAVSP